MYIDIVCIFVCHFIQLHGCKINKIWLRNQQHNCMDRKDMRTCAINLTPDSIHSEYLQFSIKNTGAQQSSISYCSDWTYLL